MDLIHKFFNIVLPPLNIILLVCFLPLYLVFRFAYCLKRHIFIENVAGKVVLVTGAASGIGEQIAYEYAKRGACLVLVDIREDRLGPVAEKAKFLGSPDVLAVGADVSKLQDSQRFIEAAVDHFGKLDHLVNNAGTVGLFQIGVSNLEMITTSTPQVHEIMDVNFWGTAYSTHFALQHLIKSKGKIIVIASGKQGSSN
ncbi:hypothetical protein JCGZ_26420 [Jatropha curcas]|uniref:Uncharacterized protein n=1 Tax=Jatropha curcas TaxID=180498 RepID=A0A067JST3_JATCU|nr:hypothetical protein JCGZ_26420 [Jatropha curcas]